MYIFHVYMYMFSTNQRQWVMSPLPFECPPADTGIKYVYLYVIRKYSCIYLVPIKDNV